MSRKELRFVTTSIIHECHKKNVTVSETLAAFMARARVLESPELFHMDKKMTEEEIDDLILACVDRLCARDSPLLKSIQLQVAFEEEYKRQSDAISRKNNTKNAKLAVVLKEIEHVRVKSDSDFDALSVLYRKIFNFVMVCSGADQLNDRVVERESAAALESVFPRVALSSFVSLSPADKRTQLHELSNIVFGIRMFNKEIGMGGEGIRDVNGGLDEELETLISELGRTNTEVETVLEQYVDLMRFAQHPGRRDEVKGSELVRRLRHEMAFWRQMQQFQDKLESERGVVAEHIARTREVFNKDMLELQDIVGSKTSVPKEKVYPRFDALATMWSIFQEESERLTLLQNVLKQLTPFMDMPFKPVMRARDVETARKFLAGEPEPAAAVPAETQAPSGGGGSEEPDGETVLVGRESLQDYNVALEFRGFDALAIAEREGLLLPGNRDVGVVRHRGKYYGFADAASAGNFMSVADKAIQGVVDAARAEPALVHLLGLASTFPSVSIHHMVAQGIDMGDGSLLYRGGVDTRVSKEVGAQTETHAVESYIDKDYEWNEWALRRKALMLTNLRTKRTHSTQTAESHFRRDNATQHYPQREKDTQTKKDSGTAPRRESNYITGLRGHPDEKMHVVNISLEL